MGSCGCGDYRGDFRFKGPDGSWYVLELYPSCQYCDTPAGITLYKFNEKEMKLWAADDLPEVVIPYVGIGFEVIHPRRFLELLEKAELCENGFEGIEEDFYIIFKNAVWETRKKDNGELDIPKEN